MLLQFLCIKHKQPPQKIALLPTLLSDKSCFCWLFGQQFSVDKQSQKGSRELLDTPSKYSESKWHQHRRLFSNLFTVSQSTAKKISCFILDRLELYSYSRTIQHHRFISLCSGVIIQSSFLFDYCGHHRLISSHSQC